MYTANMELIKIQLAEAQRAYHNLQTGVAPRVVVDQNGERVEFVAADSQKLYSYIQSLQALLPSATVGRPSRSSDVHLLMVARLPAISAVETVETRPVQENAMMGGMDGALRNAREMMSWTPPIISPDRQNGQTKEVNDARGLDIVQNDGLLMGAVHTHRDSIIGTQFRLICTPDYDVLGADEDWAAEFSKAVESEFNLMADSSECWFDAARKMTLTDMLRLSIGTFLMRGEVLQTVEWITNDKRRPFSTALQTISPTRLSNPNRQMDTQFLRQGILRDNFGQPLTYYIQSTFPNDYWNTFEQLQWKEVPATKPWGRRQVIHITEKLQPDQTRGVADMVATLKKMKMTEKFQDITLQNAVVNATYAAAIESELPSEVVFAAMGAGGNGMQGMLGEYMDAMGKYAGAGSNIGLDGVKMPHLFPGTKLNMQQAGTPGGVGTAFEESLLRYIAAPLGLSYEQFAKDYSKTNYSSARASMAETWKFMQSRKKVVADRHATMIYELWLEERINAGKIPLPPGKGPALFYDPVMREALVSCQWIGAARGQVDEVKETTASILRIASGLSTYQSECAQLGTDYRKVFQQHARENAMMKELDLAFDTVATKPVLAAMSASTATPDAPDDQTEEETPAPAKPAPAKKGAKK